MVKYQDVSKAIVTNLQVHGSIEISASALTSVIREDFNKNGFEMQTDSVYTSVKYSFDEFQSSLPWNVVRPPATGSGGSW